MTTEYQKALDDLNKVYGNKHISEVSDEQFGTFYIRNSDTIRRALKAMDALMGEPSQSMCKAGYNHEWSGGYDRQGSHAEGKYMEYTQSLRQCFGDSVSGYQAGEVWTAMRDQMIADLDINNKGEVK